MKILHIISKPPRSLGGVEINTKNIASNLMEIGITCDILACDLKISSDSYSEVIDGIMYYYAKKIPFISKKFNIFNIFGFLRKNLNRYDVIHYHSFIYFNSLQAMLFSKFYKIPCVLSIEGGINVPLVLKKGSIMRKFFSWLDLMIKKILGKIIIDNSDSVISVSKEDLLSISKKLLCNRKKNNFWIPNCVNIFDDNSKYKRQYITFIGRLEELKGFDDFLKISEEINKKYPKIPIMIVGNGEFVDEIDKMKGKLNITHYNKILHKHIYKIYQQSRVFLMTSWAEGLPTVILESMAYQTPVVSTNVGGIPELIIHGTNGFLYNPGDNEKAIEYVLKLLEDDNLSANFVKNSKELIDKKFSCKMMARKYQKLYDMLLYEKNKN